MIRRIQILNYKCFKYVDVRMDRFHVLVGPNASGKTSFMDAISILGDLLNHGLEDSILLNGRKSESRGRASRVEELFFNYSSDRFEIAIELDIPKKLRNKSEKFKSVRYEIAIGKEKTEKVRILNEVLWFCPDAYHNLKTSNSKSIVFPKLFLSNVDVPDSIITKRAEGKKAVVKKIDSERDYFRDEKTNWNNMFRFGPNKSALGNLPEAKDRFPISIWIKKLLKEGINVLALNSHFMSKPASPSLSRKFKMDGSNIALVIEQLEREDKKRFNRWIEHLRTVLPDLKNIKTTKREEDNYVYFLVEYENIDYPIPPWLLSDGTLRLLALTLLAYIPKQTGIYLIEEPENGIHPKALEAVFQSLSSIYDGQVLLATHSPLMLALADLNQILCFARDMESGAADIVRGNQHPKLKDWTGEIDIGTLYASGVLG